MKKIKIEFSKPFYKRMQLYILALMFVLIGMLFSKVVVYPALFLSCIGLIFWFMAISYGRLWELDCS